MAGERALAGGYDPAKGMSMFRWRRRAALVLLLVACCLVVGSCSNSESPVRQIETQTAQQAGPRTGQQIFASTCAACHGEAGEGADNWKVRDDDGRLPPPPLNGDGHTWHHPDAVLYGIVSGGGLGIGFGSNMPAFKDELTREEIIAVLEYVKTLWEGKEIDSILIAEAQRELSLTAPYPKPGD